MFKRNYKKNFWKFTYVEKNKGLKTYGRCINLSMGLILGLLIDKVLFISSKGLSIVIPPFSVILMNKGIVLYSIRFERDFEKFEFLLKHFIKK